MMVLWKNCAGGSCGNHAAEQPGQNQGHAGWTKEDSAV